MMILKAIALVFFFVLSLAKEQPIDFCDPKWCPNQGKHIACENDGSFAATCGEKHWIEDLKPHKALILRLHNEARNKIALGEVPRFDPAVRMPALRWDKKMAKMAELNVKTCHFEHDECRATPEFPYCGQNIFFAKTTLTNYTVEDLIKEAVDMWFVEHKDCSMDIINSFNITIPQSGHFTALMLDRNDRTGCSFIHSIYPRKRRKPLHQIIFTCNYPSTNIRDVPTYKCGPTASLCQKTHTVYKGLCAKDEVIDPNDYSWYWS